MDSKRGDMGATITWFVALIVVFLILILFFSATIVLKTQKFLGLKDDKYYDGNIKFDKQESMRDFVFLMRQETEHDSKQVNFPLLISSYNKTNKEVVGLVLQELLEDKRIIFLFKLPFDKYLESAGYEVEFTGKNPSAPQSVGWDHDIPEEHEDTTNYIWFSFFNKNQDEIKVGWEGKR